MSIEFRDRTRPNIPGHIPLEISIGSAGISLTRRIGETSDKDHFIIILPEEVSFVLRALKRREERWD